MSLVSCPVSLIDDMLTPTWYTPPHHTAADTAHGTHSTQPALQPNRTTPRAEDKPPQTHRPHSNGLCSPLSKGPDPGSAQRHVNAGSPVQTALIKKKLKLKLKKNKSAHIIVPGWLWIHGAAAAAALPDVGGPGGWLCQYPVAPTASVAVARLVGMFATVVGVLSY